MDACFSREIKEITPSVGFLSGTYLQIHEHSNMIILSLSRPDLVKPFTREIYPEIFPDIFPEALILLEH